MVKACSLSYFITFRCRIKNLGQEMCRFPSFFDIPTHPQKGFLLHESLWTKWWNQISHHFTSLSFFILGPASFNETTSHPSWRRRIIKNIKHHWSKNTTPNQSNYWTCQISSELGAFPFRLDQPDCLTHLHSELCLSTTALVSLTPNSLRGWGRCIQNLWSWTKTQSLLSWCEFVSFDNLETETRKPRKEN